MAKLLRSGTVACLSTQAAAHNTSARDLARLANFLLHQSWHLPSGRKILDVEILLPARIDRCSKVYAPVAR